MTTEAEQKHTPDGDFVMRYLGGNYPVQAEGTVDGHAFYFRARGQSWEFHVAPSDGLIFSDSEVFYMDEPYGDGPFDAGWMPEEEARAFIFKGVAAFRQAIARATGAQ
jgi:hypothetical protein